MSFVPKYSVSGDLTQSMEEFVGSSGVAITVGHAVKLAAGYLELADAAGDPIVGVAAETASGDGTARVKVYTNADIRYLNTANAALAQSDEGKYMDLASSSQVDETPALTTSGQVVCVRVNPYGGGTSTGLFKIVEHQLGDDVTQV